MSNREQNYMQAEEQLIGYEENKVLREQLNNLHVEYNRLVDQINKEYTEGFKQNSRISSMGSRKVITNKDSVINQSYVVGQANFMSSRVSNNTPSYQRLDRQEKVVKK